MINFNIAADTETGDMHVSHNGQQFNIRVEGYPGDNWVELHHWNTDERKMFSDLNSALDYIKFMLRINSSPVMTK